MLKKLLIVLSSPLLIMVSLTNSYSNGLYNPVIGKKGGAITVSSYSSPKTFNIYLASDRSSTDILSQMYVGLVSTDPFTTELKPELANSWTISPDKRTYTVKLKKGLLWSDGKPITADDVVFTFNSIISNPDIDATYITDFTVNGKFPEIKKVDNLTVTFTTFKPSVIFERNGLSAPIVPKHILEKLIKRDLSGKIAFNTWGELNSEPKSIVCNGPFKLKKFSDDYNTVLERNDNYWRKDSQGSQLPYIDEYVVKQVFDTNDEISSFISGTTDLINFNNRKDIEKKSGNFTIENLGEDDGSLFLMFNQSTAKDINKKPLVNPIKSIWFKNVKFRQALAHAIDKQTMIKSIYKELASPQISDISQQNPFYNPNVTVYDYDLSKASKIFKEAGFKKNKSGNLIDSKGNIVRFNLTTNSGNPTRDSICNIIKKDWEKLGIEVNYRPTQFNMLIEKIDETLDWDAMVMGLTGNSVDPHTAINSWRLSGRMHMFNMGNQKQDAQWKGRETSYEPWEKEVRDLWEKASQEFDKVKRKNFYFKAQKIVSDNLPFLYTVSPIRFVGYKNSIGNVFPIIRAGSGINTVNWNLYEQYIK